VTQQLPDRVAAAREFYAKIVSTAGGELRNDLERAFELVTREHFLGVGPWYAVGSKGAYVETPTDDPIHVYQNLVFALDRSRGINNGEPCLHAQMLTSLDPKRGDTALHIGCGTGYYSAILTLLVGSSGKVIAFEIEPDLASLAREYLRPWRNVEVCARSGSGFRVTEALKSGDLGRARSLVRHVAPDSSAVFIGQNWWPSSASSLPLQRSWEAEENDVLSMACAAFPTFASVLSEHPRDCILR
jgi:protein-L-isoaspartate O-methyltransferase